MFMHIAAIKCQNINNGQKTPWIFLDIAVVDQDIPNSSINTLKKKKLLLLNNNSVFADHPKRIKISNNKLNSLNIINEISNRHISKILTYQLNIDQFAKKYLSINVTKSTLK